MRRVLMLIPLLALAGCKKEVPPQGAVKVTVAYSGFVPGCVRVVARDLARGEELTEEIDDKTRLATGQPLIVAVLPPDDWGASLEVRTEAFEGARTCAGTPVATQTAPVTVVPATAVPVELRLEATDGDGDGYVARPMGTDCRDDLPAVNPGAQELCNDVDDNCNEVRDQEELQLGQACTEGDSCPGTRQCRNGSVVCGDIPTGTLAYPDLDGDDHGDRNASAVRFCGAVPADHFSGPNDDCDDTRANVYTGAPEQCDGRDNDCDGAEDEIFADLGDTCTESVTQCGGERRCTADGSGTTCVATQPQTPWYRDEDGDGIGANPEVTRSCPQPAGLVSQGGDCNDGNPFTYPGAAELCDELDNNCDDQPEEVATRCPGGTRTWADRIVPADTTTQLWHSVSTWTPGGVWAVGDNNRRAVLTPSSSTFQVTNATAGCGQNTTAWYTVWADPENNGRAYFGSAGGRLAYQDTGSTSCTQVTSIAPLAVRGLVGIRNAGTLEFYGASTSSTPGEGAAFLWNGATTVTFNSAANDLTDTTDVHGRTRDTVFVAAGYDSPPASRRPDIYRYNPGTSNWDAQLPQSATGDHLKAIWVVNDKVAFAGGNAGTVFRWDGSTWSPLPFPNNTDSLLSIIAFGASSAYAATHDGGTGRVYRWDGTNWQQIHQAPGVKFNDITGTSPEDLWVVGTGGHIYHWPN